ncbi:MAG: GntR family transcriptional regulator [Candidatus Riflebacteria bacterium]|nr:GntR family transcriptional regulator [Candidatus Riflebacteria bacterium]
MIKVDETAPVPIYVQIVQGFKREILRGVFGPDHRLPSIRDLAVELKVNPNTIAKAYQEMETQGIIYFKRGQGAFVAPGTEEERMKEARTEIKRLFGEILAIARSLNLTDEQLQSLLNDLLAGRTHGPKARKEA